MPQSMPQCRKFLVVGGEPSLIAGTLADHLSDYNIEIAWHYNRPMLIVEKIPSGCEGVIIIKDMVRHSLAESAAEQAKVSKIPWSYAQRKWAKAEPLLREKGLLTLAPAEAQTPKPCKPSKPQTSSKPSKTETTLSKTETTLSTTETTLSKTETAEIAEKQRERARSVVTATSLRSYMQTKKTPGWVDTLDDLVLLVGDFTTELRKHHISSKTVNFLCLGDSETPLWNAKFGYMSRSTPAGWHITVAVPVADAARIVGCNPDALMQAVKKSKLPVGTSRIQTDDATGTSRWFVSLNAAQHWHHAQKHSATSTTPQQSVISTTPTPVTPETSPMSTLPVTPASVTTQAVTPRCAHNPVPKKSNGQPAAMYMPHHDTWLTQQQVADRFGVTKHGVKFWHNTHRLRGETLYCADGHLNMRFDPQAVAAWEAKWTPKADKNNKNVVTSAFEQAAADKAAADKAAADKAAADKAAADKAAADKAAADKAAADKAAADKAAADKAAADKAAADKAAAKAMVNSAKAAKAQALVAGSTLEETCTRVLRTLPLETPAPLAACWYESSPPMLSLVPDLPVFHDEAEALTALQDMIQANPDKYMGHLFTLQPAPLATVMPRLKVVLDLQ